MSNVLRALVYDGEVSLTLADTTELVREGVKLHNLRSSSATLFGRALSLAVFQGACLKETRGEMSFSLRSDGACGEICVSADQSLNVRGYLQNGYVEGLSEGELLGKEGSLTVIRQDGYSRPFVGASALIDGDIDGQFEEYYKVSEQLPTFMTTIASLDEKGEVAFAGVLCLQPLPFASQKTMPSLPSKEDMRRILALVKAEDLIKAATGEFGALQTVTEKTAIYKCRCSKAYLGEVLVSLGEAQMRQIIREDGAVRIHCHYCNKDYEFFEEDADDLFAAGGES